MVLTGAEWRVLLRCARYQESTLNNRRSTKNSAAESRSGLTITIRVAPRYRGDLLPIDEQREIYVPAFFEAGFLRLQPTATTAAVNDDVEGIEPAVWLEMGPGTFKGDPPAVRSIRIVNPIHGISAEQFHRIQYATYRRLAVAAAAGTREELSSWTDYEEKEGRIEGGKVQRWRERRVTFDDLARRPVGRPSLEEAVDLAQVAHVGKQGAPNSTKAVMDNFHVSRSTAQRWLRRARATNAA